MKNMHKQTNGNNQWYSGTITGLTLVLGTARGSAVMVQLTWYNKKKKKMIYHVSKQDILMSKHPTVWCRYNAVNFPRNPDQRHALTGKLWSIYNKFDVSCMFEVWFTFCCCHHSAICIVLMDWTAVLNCTNLVSAYGCCPCGWGTPLHTWLILVQWLHMPAARLLTHWPWMLF